MYDGDYNSRSLFQDSNWFEYSTGIIHRAENEVANLDKDVFEANSIEEITEHIVSKYEIKPIVLNLDSMQKELDSTTIHYEGGGYQMPFSNEESYSVSGHKITVKIPFEGSEDLFRVQPGRHIMRHFDGNVSDGVLSFTRDIEESRSSADVIQKIIDAELRQYETEIGYANAEVHSFNQQLRQSTKVAAESKYARLDKLDSIKTALKIPLEKSKNPSPLNKVEIKVKRITPLSGNKEEVGGYISDEEYNSILESIRNMGASMETTRGAESKDEEALRDMLLVGLASSITGGVAGGELFRKNGKTDICVPFKNKAAFVAECKLWKGEKYTNEGVTQLLGYTTWRDAKTALIIFNKGAKNFSDIQRKIPEIFKGREDYVREIPQRDGEWRFVLTKPDDVGRHIDVHVMLFDVRRDEDASWVR